MQCKAGELIHLPAQQSLQGKVNPPISTMVEFPFLGNFFHSEELLLKGWESSSQSSSGQGEVTGSCSETMLPGIWGERDSMRYTEPAESHMVSM